MYATCYFKVSDEDVKTINRDRTNTGQLPLTSRSVNSLHKVLADDIQTVVDVAILKAMAVGV